MEGVVIRLGKEKGISMVLFHDSGDPKISLFFFCMGCIL